MCRGQPEQPVSWGVLRLHRVTGHGESESPRETRVARAPPPQAEECSCAKLHGVSGEPHPGPCAWLWG